MKLSYRIASLLLWTLLIVYLTYLSINAYYANNPPSSSSDFEVTRFLIRMTVISAPISIPAFILTNIVAAFIPSAFDVYPIDVNQIILTSIIMGIAGYYQWFILVPKLWNLWKKSRLWNLWKKYQATKEKQSRLYRIVTVSLWVLLIIYLANKPILACNTDILDDSLCSFTFLGYLFRLAIITAPLGSIVLALIGYLMIILELHPGYTNNIILMGVITGITGYYQWFILVPKLRHFWKEYRNNQA